MRAIRIVAVVSVTFVLLGAAGAVLENGNNRILYLTLSAVSVQALIASGLWASTAKYTQATEELARLSAEASAQSASLADAAVVQAEATEALVGATQNLVRSNRLLHRHAVRSTSAEIVVMNAFGSTMTDVTDDSVEMELRNVGPGFATEILVSVVAIDTRRPRGSQFIGYWACTYHNSLAPGESCSAWADRQPIDDFRWPEAVRGLLLDRLAQDGCPEPFASAAIVFWRSTATGVRGSAAAVETSLKTTSGNNVYHAWVPEQMSVLLAELDPDGLPETWRLQVLEALAEGFAE